MPLSFVALAVGLEAVSEFGEQLSHLRRADLVALDLGFHCSKLPDLAFVHSPGKQSEPLSNCINLARRFRHADSLSN